MPDPISVEDKSITTVAQQKLFLGSDDAGLIRGKSGSVTLVPILTMRVLAEERRQKTDQLLYSLPITTTQVVLGKYLALLAVYLIPLAVICVYP